MPDEGKNFFGSLVLDFRGWWRHMQAKNTKMGLNWIIFNRWIIQPTGNRNPLFENCWKTTTSRRLPKFGISFSLDTKNDSVKLREVAIKDYQRSAGSYLIFAHDRWLQQQLKNFKSFRWIQRVIEPPSIYTLKDGVFWVKSNTYHPRQV